MSGVPYRFDADDRLMIGGRPYRYLRPQPFGHVLRHQSGDIDEHFSHDDMERIVSDPGYRHDRRYYSKGAVYARARSGVESINDLPAEERSLVTWKHEYVTRFLKLEAKGKATRSDESMAEAIKTIDEEVRLLDCARLQAANPPAVKSDGSPRKTRSGTQITYRAAPCAKTLRIWLAIMAAADWSAHALRDRYRFCGNHTPRLHVLVHELLYKHARGYMSETRPTIVACYDALETELKDINTEREAAGEEKLATPSIRPLTRAINALPKFATVAARHGLEYASRLYKLVTDHVEATRPGERVEMDEWEVHLETLFKDAGIWSTLTDEQKDVVKGRWIACIAIDVATRCILGLEIAPSATADLALSTLSMVVSEKSRHAALVEAKTPWDMQLTPECIVTDGGSAFISEKFKTAVADLRCAFDVPPGAQPHLRGTIERFFKTLDDKLLCVFTGRTFTGVAAKGDYNAQARASLTPTGLAWCLGRFIVDVYHNSPHEGLAGETPRNAWLRLGKLYGVGSPPGRERRRTIFGIEFERETSNRGIRFLGLHYSNDVVGRAILDRGLRTMTIRVDRNDLGEISVFLDEQWLTVACRTEGFDGIDIESWIEVATRLRRQYADEAKISRSVILDALAAIREHAEHAQRLAGITALRPNAATITAAEEQNLRGLKIPVKAALEDDRDDKSWEQRATPVADAVNDESTPPAAASGPKKSFKIEGVDDE